MVVEASVVVVVVGVKVVGESVVVVVLVTGSLKNG